MEPEAKASGVKRSAQGELWRCVFPSDRGHTDGPLCRRQEIDHQRHSGLPDSLIQAGQCGWWLLRRREPHPTKANRLVGALSAERDRSSEAALAIVTSSNMALTAMPIALPR